MNKEDTKKHLYPQGCQDNTPGSSQPTSDADKISEAELRNQLRQDAQLMDKDFSTWCDAKIREGHNGWKKHTEMCCDHREAHKELLHRDPISPPLEYMKTCGVFKAKKTNAYDLCHFYCVGASGEFPTFPAPHEPTSRNMLKKLLETV